MYLVDVINNLYMPRKNLFHFIEWPDLKIVTEYCMTGICKNVAGHFPGTFPGYIFLVYQNPHHFGNSKRASAAVKLYDYLFVKIIHITVVQFVTPDNILNRSADKEILLLNP